VPGGRRGQLSQALRSLTAVRREVGHDRALSIDETIHVAETISRREFLSRAAAATGTGVILAACTTDGSRSRERPPSVTRADGSARVVIVGAGLAGMSAAYWLTRAGVPTRLYEARDRVGGRCWSAREFEGGQVAEHGGEFVDTRHVHLRLLARELDLRMDDLWEAEVPGTGLTYVDGAIVGRVEVLADMEDALGRLMRLAEANGSYFAREAGPGALALDRVTMAEWFDENVPGALDSPLGRVFAAEQAAWWGADPGALSATNLVDYFVVDYPGSDERYTVHGGTDLIPKAILDELPTGTVELEVPLEAVRRRADATFELVFAGVSRPIVADQVILTLPFTALQSVDLEKAGFTEGMLTAIRRLGMGTNAKVLLQFSEPFPIGTWSGDLLRGDDPNFSTWESGATDGPAAGRLGLLTVYSGGRLGASYVAPEPHGPAPREVVGSTLAAIDAAAPGVSESFNGQAWLDAWASDPWVGGSYAAFLPGQYTTFWGTLGEPEGNLHFAGEHTSVFSQGFLNGAVESGNRAAIEVLTALAKPVPTPLAATLEAARKYRPRYPW
jgi:monoamine oxidase